MKYLQLALTLLVGAATVASYGQEPAQPDNTKVNKRDRSAGEVTADQQKMNAADSDLTQKIRKSITSDKSLSSYAHNLKGPVRSEDEKKSIMAKAVAAAGSADKVTDQMTVKPQQQ